MRYGQIKIDKQEKTRRRRQRSGKSPFIIFRSRQLLLVDELKMQAVVALHSLQLGKTETRNHTKNMLRGAIVNSKT